MTDYTEKVLPLIIDADGDTKALSMEGNTLGTKVIESEHSEIWEGNAFKSGTRRDVITNGASLTILVRVPSTLSFLHIYHNTFKVTGAPFTVDTFEGPTISTTGSAVPIYNLNRASSVLPLATMFVDPALSADGTNLDPDLIVGERSGGGDLEGYNEHYVLAGGNDYLFRATNDVGQNKAVSFRMSWFERLA